MEKQVQVSVIIFEFNSKSMASKAVINARSSLSWSTKKTAYIVQKRKLTRKEKDHYIDPKNG